MFAPRVFQDIGGQVAVEDGEVTVRGVARGFDAVLVAMIDQRGRIASEIVTVDDDDVFEEDVALVTPDGTELSEGPIAATVFTPGRDGVVGDGKIAGFSRADLQALDQSTRERIARDRRNQSVTRTQQQVLQLFYEESINDSGSDDQALFDVFRYTDGRTSIETVGPRSSLNLTDIVPVNRGNATVLAGANLTGIRPVSQGDTMVIAGRTNRKPDDNTVFVEVVDGPDYQRFGSDSTDQWGPFGVWVATLDVPPDIEPGTYTLRSDDGDNTDTVRVAVRSAQQNETEATGTTSQRP